MAQERPLFEGVKFLIDSGLPEPIRRELQEGLAAQGAQSAPRVFEATHVITETLDFEGHLEQESNDITIVTPLWVKRCIEHQKLQEAKYYSPHPGKIMSGVVATSSDLPRNDVEALCAGVLAYGAPQGDKYNTAMHYKDKLGLEVLIPAWFQDCVQLQQRLPTGPYSFPNPARYKPLAALDPIGAVNHPVEAIDSKLKSVSTTTEKSILFRTVSEAEGKQQKPEKLRITSIWQSALVLLGEDLELTDSLLQAVQASIHRNGGIAIQGEDGIDTAEVYVGRYRHGKMFERAVQRNITIGTIAWVFHCEQVERLTRPLDQLCHFPIPIHKIKGFDKYEITVTNYTGEARDYLKNLIDAAGGKFSATMSKGNTHVIAAHLGGQKAERAVHWNIPIINHTWLEDCFLEWKNIPVGGVAGSKYSKFPTGVNFMSLLGERGFLGFQDTDPRKILGEPNDRASSSTSNGKQPKRPRLEQVTTGSGEGHPQSRNPTSEVARSAGLSNPPSVKKNQEHAKNPVSEAEVAADVPSRDAGDARVPTVKRASNAADSSTPRKPGRGETPTPKGAKPISSSRKRPSALDAMDIDTGPDGTDAEDLENRSVAGPSGIRRLSLNHKYLTPDDDMDQIEKARLEPVSKPASKQPPKAKKPASTKSKQGVDAVDDTSPSRRLGKSASGPPLSGAKSKDPPDVESPPLPPEWANLKRSETDPNLLLLITDDENTTPKSPKKKATKKRKAAQPAAVQSVSSTAESSRSRASSVSEAESSGMGSISAVPGRLKRGAAAKAEANLRDHVMPDLLRHQKDLKSSQGDVRKLHVAGVPSSLKKRGRAEAPESDSDESDDDRPTAQKRKVDVAAKANGKTAAKGKGKATASPEDDDDTSSLDSVSDAAASKNLDSDEDDTPSVSMHAKKGKSPWIMTTTYDISQKDQEKLARMGAKLTEDTTKCTHLIAGKGILRTIKFIAAVANGVHIVTPDWLKASLKASLFVDPAPYLPKDAAGEKKHGFKLKDALERAREEKVFKGHKFWITNSLFKDFNDLKTVIQACGGDVTKEMVKDRYFQGQADKRHVLSTKEDRIHWSSLLKLGIPIYGKDFIYNTALRQVADWNDAQVYSPDA
ncbi:hypothetical protein FRB90_011933 [Tulasnella sp. 427]|nr:hypothetical protein FRB90_011933 [Tulasnella sp. 427]